MIGIVVVSHSEALAHAAVDLALQMGGDTPPRIEVAAGTTDGGFGTDAAAIAAAIDRLTDTEGVLVVMDLGSALLSAEMAQEFVESETRVVLSAAPFVEGLLAAVVLASAGVDLETIAAEARDALAVKRAHLDESLPGGDATPGVPADEPITEASAEGSFETSSEASFEASFEAVVHNPSGLHARPAALFVRAASRHDAEVEVTDLDNRIEDGRIRAGGRPVSGRSLISLMALGVRPGTRVRVTARGPGARAAIAELRALVEDGFGER